MTRADRLVEKLAERELDCLLVSDLVNLRYLTGFTGTNGACIVSRDERLFMTDFRYVEQAEDQVSGFELLRAERELLGEIAKRLSGRAGFDDEHLSVKAHGSLGKAVPDGVDLVAAGGLVESLRQVKDATELEAIAAATALADEVLSLIPERGLVGRTEREVALELEQEMRLRGATGPSFPSIVAGGAHGARPHAEPRDVEIPRDTLVVVDMGAELDGYCSDCTRTFATGAIGDRATEVYELVRQAQQAGLDAVAPGVKGREADAAAREVIEAAGRGEEFGHGLGHGVGLEVHEGPRLSKRFDDELVAGNVVSVEPGVYVPGEFGVRIEDLVAVEDGGPRIFTSFPKELVQVD